ncbi:hypothetical protein VTI74DRAFT_2262 [Chaetomium olivicolor]
MASQHLLIATPPSQDAILNSLLEDARAYNARQPRHAGLCYAKLDAEMPLLLNPPWAHLACWEPLAEFKAVNAHFSAQVHAFFNALHVLEDMSDKQSSDELPLICSNHGLQPVIRIVNQSFDIGLDCWHRTFHARRLTVQSPDTLPLLNRVTELRVFPSPSFSCESKMMVNMRPVSPRAPLDLATRLPHLRELDCPWLWERLPIAFSSQALRIFARVWEGHWRDSRAEFARGVRHVMPLLPSSLAKARLWFWKPDPYGDDTDQAAQMPDLVGALSLSSTASEFEDVDPVSIGLRALGSRLEELDIRALITSDLFPSGSATGHSWPCMRHLRVEFYPCAPDGRWYFSGPGGENPHATGFTITREEHYPPSQEDVDETHVLLSDEEEENTSGDELYLLRQTDMFRTLPIAERISPLLLAFASSLQRHNMPSLQDAELFTWLTWRPSDKRAQKYKGSEDAPPSAEDEPVLFRWGVGEDWRPANETMKVFEDLIAGFHAKKWLNEIPTWLAISVQVMPLVTTAHLLQFACSPDMVGAGDSVRQSEETAGFRPGTAWREMPAWEARSVQVKPSVTRAHLLQSAGNPLMVGPGGDTFEVVALVLVVEKERNRRTVSIGSAIPVATSHTRIVLLRELDTMNRPSGEKATVQTEYEWPRSTCHLIPVAASHTRTVSS